MIPTRTVGLFDNLGPLSKPPIILLFCEITEEEIIAQQFIVQDQHKGIFTAIDDDYKMLGIVKLDFEVFDYKYLGRYFVEEEKFIITPKEN